jgi:hypothetical protein
MAALGVGEPWASSGSQKPRHTAVQQKSLEMVQRNAYCALQQFMENPHG